MELLLSNALGVISEVLDPGLFDRDGRLVVVSQPRPFPGGGDESRRTLRGLDAAGFETLFDDPPYGRAAARGRLLKGPMTLIGKGYGHP